MLCRDISPTDLWRSAPSEPALEVATIDDCVDEQHMLVVEPIEHDSQVADAESKEAVAASLDLFQRFATARSLRRRRATYGLTSQRSLDASTVGGVETAKLLDGDLRKSNVICLRRSHRSRPQTLR